MTDLKSEKLKAFIKDIQKAAYEINSASVRDGKLCENVLLPLMVIFNAAAVLLFIASEQNPDWKEAIEEFKFKGK